MVFAGMHSQKTPKVFTCLSNTDTHQNTNISIVYLLYFAVNDITVLSDLLKRSHGLFYNFTRTFKYASDNIELISQQSASCLLQLIILERACRTTVYDKKITITMTRIY